MLAYLLLVGCALEVCRPLATYLLACLLACLRRLATYQLAYLLACLLACSLTYLLARLRSYLLSYDDLLGPPPAHHLLACLLACVLRACVLLVCLLASYLLTCSLASLLAFLLIWEYLLTFLLRRPTRSAARSRAYAARDCSPHASLVTEPCWRAEVHAGDALYNLLRVCLY